MMKLTRREQTTTRDTEQQQQRWFIRQGRGGQRFLCALCDERIQMITLAEAATAARLEPHDILMLAETGRLHCIKTDGAEMLFCLNSLVSLRADAERPTED